MADTEETPQQRQIRLRQARREAKLKASAQERLDKITKLSGRTPETIRDESPRLSPNISENETIISPTPASRTVPNMPAFPNTVSSEQAQMQEQYLRSLLAAAPEQQGQRPQTGPGTGDPMMEMLQSMMAGMSGDPNAANELPFSPDDLAKSTGIPSFVTDMFLGGKSKVPPSAAEVRTAQMWKIIRFAFAVIAGLYTVFTISKTTTTFGENPPAPATIQNPFVMFLTGELIVHGSRIAMSGRSDSRGIWAWFQLLKDVGRDGAILVFVLGCYTWWMSLT